MKERIPCKIEVISDHEYTCLIVCLPKQYAGHLLLFIDALRFERLGQIECCGNGRAVLFSKEEDDMLKVHFHDTSIQAVLSDKQIELLKSCCIDSVFGNYESPHVDFEFSSFDLTISFN